MKKIKNLEKAFNIDKKDSIFAKVQRDNSDLKKLDKKYSQILLQNVNCKIRINF